MRALFIYLLQSFATADTSTAFLANRKHSVDRGC